jgi:hypothetical protein
MVTRERKGGQEGGKEKGERMGGRREKGEGRREKGEQRREEAEGGRRGRGQIKPCNPHENPDSKKLTDVFQKSLEIQSKVSEHVEIFRKKFQKSEFTFPVPEFDLRTELDQNGGILVKENFLPEDLAEKIEAVLKGRSLPYSCSFPSLPPSILLPFSLLPPSPPSS